MVAQNVRLVQWWVGRYLRSAKEQEDADAMFSDGVMGLIRAVQKFDPDRGFTFSTYASQWIRNRIVNGRKKRKRHGLTWGPEDLEHVLALDAPLAEEGGATLGDVIPAPDGQEAERLEQKEMIAAAVAALPERLRFVLPYLRGERTMEGLADERGVTRARIQQSVAEARGVMRRALARASLTADQADPAPVSNGPGSAPPCPECGYPAGSCPTCPTCEPELERTDRTTPT